MEAHDMSILPASVNLGYMLKLTLLALNGVLERATSIDNIQGLKVTQCFLFATICTQACCGSQDLHLRWCKVMPEKQMTIINCCSALSACSLPLLSGVL